MQFGNTPSRHGAVPQLIHWLTALFVISGWLLGTFLDDIPKGPERAFGLYAHMTLGQCVLTLVVVRLLWRFVNPPPPPERTKFGKPLEYVSLASHYTMYVLLLAVPTLGIIVQLKRGNPLPLLGIWEMMSPWLADRAAARTVLRVHEYCADALLMLAGAHACAALLHHYVLHDRTLVRMLPRKA